jgi:asparagine synthase (glutamine-hydrolysing)
MCGFLVDTKCENLIEFARGLETMKHRGPDKTGIVNPSPGVAFGHNRLSILDLSSDADQPMQNEDGSITLVFNGEIYNYKQLKHLHNLQTKSSGDTEVLLRLFEKIGPKMFDQLDGEFAMVIYSKRSNRVYAVRDKLGIKPLYWCVKKNRLIFSSEIKGILRFIPKRMDRQSLRTLMIFGYSHGRTLYEGINQVNPGRYLECKPNPDEGWFYTDIGKPIYNSGPWTSTESDVRNSIERAVIKRMISDVPISVTLSGGLDSSIITGLMAKHSRKVKSYTLLFEGEENDDARFVADHFGTDHSEIRIGFDEAFKKIPEILKYAEEPMDKGSLIPTYFLANLVKEKVTLVGEGADECFGGYNRYIALAKLKDLSFREYFDKYLAVFPGFGKEAGGFEGYDLKDKNSALVYDLLNEIPFYHNMRIDKLFMRNSVEARVPYLDPEVVKVALNVSYDRKMDPEKKILREAFAYLLPERITWKKKDAFKIPVDDWIQKKEVKDTLMSSRIFGQTEVSNFYSEPEETRNKGRRIWLAYLITLWYDINFK